MEHVTVPKCENRNNKSFRDENPIPTENNLVKFHQRLQIYMKSLSISENQEHRNRNRYYRFDIFYLCLISSNLIICIRILLRHVFLKHIFKVDSALVVLLNLGVPLLLKVKQHHSNPDHRSYRSGE